MRWGAPGRCYGPRHHKDGFQADFRAPVILKLAVRRPQRSPEHTRFFGDACMSMAAQRRVAALLRHPSSTEQVGLCASGWCQMCSSGTGHRQSGDDEAATCLCVVHRRDARGLGVDVFTASNDVADGIGLCGVVPCTNRCCRHNEPSRASGCVSAASDCIQDPMVASQEASRYTRLTRQKD